MTNETVASLIELFKVVPEDVLYTCCPIWRNKNSLASWQDCLNNSFVVFEKSGTLVADFPHDLFHMIKQIHGQDLRLWNNTLHKSFSTVEGMEPAQYYLHQITHYMSTYGLEALGYKANPYIPYEEVNIPASSGGKGIAVIQALTDKQIVELVNDYARNVSRLTEREASLMQHIVEDGYLYLLLDEIKSFELMSIVAKAWGEIPSDPQVALRVLVNELTQQPLLIKSKEVIRHIKTAGWSSYAEKILQTVPAEKWATIFYRFKPLFLAMRQSSAAARPIINKVRRLAEQYHKPLAETSIRDVSNLMVQRKLHRAFDILNKASNRDLVKITSFASMRVLEGLSSNPCIYNIRNGKTWVTEPKNRKGAGDYYTLYNTANDILVKRLRPLLQDKVFYIPDGIQYAVPVSEKQFIGNIPWGTSIAAGGKAFTVGIHWFDQGGRIDLDLHLNGIDGEHYGWNGDFRSGGDIIYTGDMTAAPKPLGASEAYYIKKQGSYVVSVNCYNAIPDEVEFQFGISLKEPAAKSHNYIMDDMVAPPATLQFTKGRSSMTLGLIDEDDCFYFYGGSISGGRIPANNQKNYIKGVKAKLRMGYLNLTELLRKCGAKIYIGGAKPEGAIDLSPDVVTKQQLMAIIDGKVI